MQPAGFGGFGAAATGGGFGGFGAAAPSVFGAAGATPGFGAATLGGMGAAGMGGSMPRRFPFQLLRGIGCLRCCLWLAWATSSERVPDTPPVSYATGTQCVKPDREGCLETLARSLA